MDYDGMRDYLNSPLGLALMEHLSIHAKRADEEVLRLASAKQYDPMELRYRAGVTTGMSLMMDVITKLRKRQDG